MVLFAKRTPLQREARETITAVRALLESGGKLVGAETRKKVEDLIRAVKAADDDPIAQREAIDALVTESDRSLSQWRKSKLREYFESISIAVLIALSVRAFIFEPYKIPSPSMVPTLLVGDRIWVSKGTYGIRVPFTQRYLFQWRALERGEVVVFQFPREHALTRDRMAEWVQTLDNAETIPTTLASWRDARGVPAPPELLQDAWGTPLNFGGSQEGAWTLSSAGPDKTLGTFDDITLDQIRVSMVSFPEQRRPAESQLLMGCPIDPWSISSPKTYIKRIVGLPGDTIELRDNRFFLNGEEVQRSAARVGPASHYRGGRLSSQIFEETLPDGGPTYTVRTIFDDERFGPLTVPEGHLFAMGDNRDESSDGRCWGLVPEGHVKGLAKFVIFSVSSEGFDSERVLTGIK